MASSHGIKLFITKTARHDGNGDWVIAGIAGDKWNLGFLAETERQVESHLDGHLGRLPDADAKSRAIVDQMKTDEARHARTAVEYGGAELPQPLKQAMKLGSRVMTETTFRV